MIILFNKNGIIFDILRNGARLSGCKVQQVQVDIDFLDSLDFESFIEQTDSYKGGPISALNADDKIKDALYWKRYAEVNNKTQQLIESGIDYTYNNETVHYDLDIYNREEFQALQSKIDSLSFPYEIWEGNSSLEFKTKDDLQIFLDYIFNFIMTKKAEGKILRDSLQTKTLQELIEFEDIRS